MRNALGKISARGVVILSGFLALVVVIGQLSLDVRSRLRDLGAANSDNAQWVMMQTEVEALRLQYAISLAIRTPERLPEVRRWFDVFFSRLQLLDRSPVYAFFIKSPENRDRMEIMNAFVERWVPFVDGSDVALLQALPMMEAQSQEAHRAARQLSLGAHQAFSELTDDRRSDISDTLLSLALAIALTIALLILLSLALSRLYATSQRQAEENRNTGQRLQLIISASPDAIVVTNRGGWIVEFNPAAEAMFGRKRADVLGKQSLPSVVPPDRLPEALDLASNAIERALADGPQRFELDMLRHDGTLFPVELSIAVRELGKSTLIVAFMRDITALRTANRAREEALVKARASEKAKAEFIAVMSHEMRTPLNGLIGSMDLMRSAALTPDQQELLSVMRASGDILLGHMNAVLDVSRAESGDIRIDSAPFDLDRLVASSIANQAGIARKRGTAMRYDPVTGPLGDVRGDAARLQQILLNLIGNAVKFTQGGSITVETERLSTRAAGGHPDMVEIRVVDTGIGIAADDLGRIFDDFETVDSSYGREAGGTGLGLGIARRLVQALGGQIGVESELGEGSVFWFRLPLPPTKAARTIPAKGSGGKKPRRKPRKVKPLKVLIIEDNEINRFLLRRYLSDAGHSVTEAQDGTDGVAQAQATRFDAIITDISMPGMDGVEVTRRIRAGGGPSAKSRILALTAHALPDEVDKFMEAGLDACMTKPIVKEVLMAQLDGSGKPLPLVAEPAGDVLLDIGPLEDLEQELGGAMVAQLIGRMLAEGDRACESLPQMTAPDAAMAHMAHQFAGSCATFGALSLRKSLVEIEVAIKTGAPDAALAAAARLPAIWAETRAALQAHTESLG